MTRSSDQLVFVPLGGLGEIGMNAALYGFGPEGRRKWILVDCGLSFAGPEAPGVDIVLPDLRYIIEERANLLGIIITHAHEDHIGALAALWPSLRAPVYCTQFAAGLLATRRLSEPGAPKVPMNIVAQGGRVTLGPFDIEFVPVAHSIPESNALAIRTPVGLIVHTGDWKIDPTPQVGLPTDEKRLRELGDEGVLALVCDSTNVMRDGISPSEADVAAKLKELISSAPGRVAVTTFASNVARLRAVAEAAMAAQREVVVVGRAMDRVIDVARECGYLDGIPAFRSADTYGYLPRDKVVALLTGSQGEPRAALSRIASDDHPEIALSPGDRVIFSSRTIPGNEKSVGNILNALARDNIEIITDRTHLVHVSGHPRREEMARLYGWLKPKIVIPAHGEDLHLSEHAAFARGLGVKHVVRAGNGDVVAIGADSAGKIDQVPHGRLYQDGMLLVNANEKTISERRRLSFAGMISVAVAIDEKGGLAGDPEIAVLGLPAMARDGTPFDELVADAVSDLLDNIPKARRRDPEALRNALERGLRSAVNEEWGKKPLVHALVIEV
ncbi:ribonuclease J [Bosea caraganae]|uniref:Ribonuclease J n=1 Tax=Bosea caraganae TaxID=2763117 RepID=A0A370L5C7_9HYPH|nr:ribonuclease J [Bosea caraganae]RDJ24139.1 ribonuclease J [Bosea caraganae]RDJ30181.1 ribonuclease J [Bosea caraganae]